MFLAAMLSTMSAWADTKVSQSGACGVDANSLEVTYTLSDEDGDGTFDKLTISGSGAMKDYFNYKNDLSKDNRPWADEKDNIKQVEIGDGVTRIGNNAFRAFKNKSLQGIVLPNSVTSIGSFGIANCDSLPSLILSEELTEIGDSAFLNSKKLTEIVIPEGVTKIGKWAFGDCVKLASITLPSSLKTIGEYLCVRCSELTGINFPSNCKVTTISRGAFQNCKNLSEVSLPNGLKTISADAFYGCPFTSITLPSTLKTIGNHAFCYCKNLQAIDIPNGVTTLGEHVFTCCYALESISVPTGITSVGPYLLSYCTSLKSFEVPSDWTKIPNNLFRSCEGLEEVEFPAAGMVEIGSGAFEGCKSLQSSGFSIPSTVNRIGTYAFSGCSSLTNVTVPEGVDSLKSGLFQGCTGLTSVTVSSTLKVVDSGVFKGCNNPNLTSISLPSTVTSIGDNAFEGCSGLTSFTIPADVTNLGGSALKGCTGLTSVTIPSKVSSLGTYVFANCTNLTSVTIEDGVTLLGYGAFSGCTGLTSVIIPSSVAFIAKAAFANCNNMTSIEINGNPKFENAYCFPSQATVTLNIKAKEGENGEYWTTFYNEQVNCRVDENTVIYKTGLFGDFLTLTELSKDKIIPKNTPVILKSNASPVVLTITTDNTKNNVSDNSLKGVKEVEGKTADDKTYVLNKKSTAGVGFYKLKAGATLGLNKAYLTHESATARDFYSFDDETMGIENVTIIGRSQSQKQVAQPEIIDGNIYDLQGRRVAQAKKGLYVVNGKKIVIK